MRPGGTFLLGVMTVLTAFGCERRPDFKAKDENSLAGLNGLYREKSASSASTSAEFEDVSYSEFIVQDGRITFHRLVNETEERKDVVGTLTPSSRMSFSLVPEASLSSLAVTQQDLQNFNNLFSDSAKIRVLKNGSSLKITRIVGTNRVSQSWVRVGDVSASEGETSLLGKVQTKAKNLAALRTAFLDKWNDKDLVLLERVELATTRGGQKIVRVKSGDKMAEEVVPEGAPGENLRKILILKYLKFAEGKVLINRSVPGNLSFRLLRGTADKLSLRLIAEVDEKLYQNPPPLEGLLEEDGDGFKVTYTPPRGKSNYDQMIYRYQLVGVNTAKPTKPTELQEEKPEEPVSPKPPLRRR